MADLIKNHSAEQALMLIDELHNSSVDMLRLLSELTQHFRDLMIVKVVKGDKKPLVCSTAKMKALETQAQSFDIKEIMAILSVLQSSAAAMQNGNRRCEMEMALIRLCNPQIRQDISSLERRISALESNPPTIVTKTEPAKPDKTAEEEEEIPLPEYYEVPAPQEPEEDISSPADALPSPTTAPDGITPVTQWGEIIAVLRGTCPIIAGVLQGSSAYIEGDRLLIDTQNSQFRTLVNGNNSVYRDSIRKAAQSVLGKVYKLGPYHAKPAEAQDVDPLQSFAEKLKQLEQN
jgi:DNA polymerase-3 subunit gamma/tau